MNNLIRQQYLDAIGIQSWQLKTAVDNDISDILEYEAAEIIAEPPPVVKKEPQSFIIEPEQFLPELLADHQSPVSVSHLAVKAPVETKSTTVETLEKNEEFEFVDSDSELYQTIKNCKQCPDRQTRLNTLAGQGSKHASVFVISEAPNAEEDRSGHYLTEQTLSLFKSMLHSINSYDDYFFTGIIKCHSLSDFLVSDEDISRCASYLHTQIEQSKPSVLLVLGAIQSQTMLQSTQSFNELRGKIYHVTINNKQYPLVVSYHPAYLIRNPIYKREALKDLIMVKNLIK